MIGCMRCAGNGATMDFFSAGANGLASSGTFLFRVRSGGLAGPGNPRYPHTRGEPAEARGGHAALQALPNIAGVTRLGQLGLCS